MVSDGHVKRMPAGDGGLPGGHLPGAGGEDLSHDDVLDCRRRDSAFSRAPLMAMPPRSDPEKSFNEPMQFAIGVRAPATITDVVISFLQLRAVVDDQSVPAVASTTS